MHRIAQSPTDPAFVQDPYRFYARARAAGDLVYWDDYGMVVACSHAAVGQLLKDRRFGREPLQPLDVPDRLAPFYAVEAHSMLELEPPRHTRLRGLVMRAFTSRRIGALAPQIEALCDGLIASFPKGSFDLLTAYAQPIPVITIARLLGVPEDRADDLLAWSNAMVKMYVAGRSRAQEDAAIAATESFVDFLRHYVDERRSSPRDDLISELIAAEEAGEKLSTDELITTCILLLNAGHEATVHTIGNGVKLMLETGLRGATDPARLVEEILRFDPPLHLFTRWAYEDITLFGHRFARGDQVGLLLASAGRDGALFPEPDVFDPSRAGAAHHAFGAGLHFCVGAPLARLELQIAFTRLFLKCPNLRLAATPTYSDIYHFHGLDRLMVTV
ncbi:MAG: cytochrome P450 [Pseudomonadota bacterium]